MALKLGRGRGSDEVSVGFKPPRSTASKVSIVLAVALVVAAAGLVAYDRAAGEQFFPGTRIGGVIVGSRTAEEAEVLLKQRVIAPLHQTMTITAADFSLTTSPWDMGLRVDLNDIVRDALVRQHAEPLQKRFWHRVFGEPKLTALRPSVNELVFTSMMHKTFKKIDQAPVDAQLQVKDDKLVIVPHKLGRKVDDEIAERQVFQAMLEGASRVELPVKVEQPALKSTDITKVIVVSTSANTLKLYDHGKLKTQFGVATGTGGYPTPHGQFHITEKRYMPTWYNPHDDWSMNMPEFIPPGPNNPLGTRAMNLNVSGIRIHGTPHDSSIGSNASHGCIRMHIPDAEKLFDMVDVNTPVLIV